MDILYTENSLLQFIYGEKTLSEYADLDDSMNADPVLRTTFRDLYDDVASMPDISLSPSDTAVLSILKYSRNDSVRALC